MSGTDKELAWLAAIVRAMLKMTRQQRERTLTYLDDRFGRKIGDDK